MRNVRQDLDRFEEDTYTPTAKRQPAAVKSKTGTVKPAQVKKTGKILKEKDIREMILQKYRQRNSTQQVRNIIDILTPFVEEHPDDPLMLKILAFCHIEVQDYQRAERYLPSLLRLNQNDVETLNALAYLGLSNGNLEQPIQFLLDAIYLDGKNTRLKQNLEKLRKANDPKVFFRMTKPSEFLFMTLPQEDPLVAAWAAFNKAVKNPMTRLAIMGAGVIVVALLLYAMYPVLVNWANNARFNSGIGANRITHVTIQDIEKLTEERKLYNIRLSEDEIKRKFELVRNYLEQRQFNKASITINELLNSNASEFIKERVGILAGFIPDMDPQAIDYMPPVPEVIRAPFLYQNVYIRWSGLVANLEHKERKETVFDLLINFVDKAVVEGIAESHYPGFQNVTSGDKIVVFGQIAGITLDNKIVIKGKQIIRIGKTE